jgi:hypothetical protein
MAMAFGGELTPPGMFNGMEVKKNEYRLSSAQVLDSASRSNISPLWSLTLAIDFTCTQRRGVEDVQTYRLACPIHLADTRGLKLRLVWGRPV